MKVDKKETLTVDGHDVVIHFLANSWDDDESHFPEGEGITFNQDVPVYDLLGDDSFRQHLLWAYEDRITELLEDHDV